MPWRELEKRLSGKFPPRGENRAPNGQRLAFGPEPERPGSYRRAPYQPGEIERGRRRRSRTPSCTRTPTSASSTAPAIRRRWSTEAVRLGLSGLAITDHDGFYGVVRFAEAAAAHGLPTIFGSELVPRSDAGSERRRRPGGHPPARARPRPGRLRPAVHRDQRRPRERRREGPAGARPGGPRRRPPTGTGWSSPAAARARSRRRWRRAANRPRPESWTGWSRCSAGTTSRSSSPRTGTPTTTPDWTPWPGWRGEFRLPALATVQRPLRRAREKETGHRAGRGPGPAQPGRAGRLAARGRQRAPALRRGDGGPVRPLPRRGRHRARAWARSARSTWP